ncbi:MAG: HEAT repeat domain-containing protein, partial [Thermoguttaceae bacterium]|nr:HEAT repeat domain-containing protein [Thermoguttaceae bacterium]
MLHTPLRTVVVWLAIVAAASKAPADPYAEVMKYQVGQPRTAVAAIEAEIRTAKPEQLRQIETRLLAILESPAATTDAKAWVCRQLRQAGSERSAEALGALLNNPELANFARLALQSIPGAKVDAVLREAVGKLDGDLKAGVVLTIGARADRQATPILAPLASDANPTVAEAALYALGQIGGPEALAALQAAKTPDRLSRYRLHAILRCAERLAADGKPAEAAAVYRQLAGP